ncbi:MAG: cation diffusion facilitator family transporter [Candidatus Heimdallarchaeota archaeon]
MENQKSQSVFSDHLFEFRSVEKRRLIVSLSITSVVMVLEGLGGILTHSLALISDAWHMFTHSFAITISLVAILIARKPPCHHRTFGLYRAEILAAFVNALFLLLVAAFLIYEAIMKLLHPVEILAIEMLIIAVIGLITNLISILLLQSGQKTTLNIRALLFHIIADTASSIGIVLAAIVIYLTSWYFVDPLVSLLICFLIIIWALSLLKESTRILLEMTPQGLTTDMIKTDLQQQFPEIKKLYNIHLWTITSNMLVFSAHININPGSKVIINGENIISKINDFLSAKYSIIESTIQISYDDTGKPCNEL